MKHGLMYYLSSSGPNGMKNVGDYIQSVAADQFMRASTLIEREALHAYSGEKTKVILNGWFMHHPENFPPSPDIEPLFISFHLRPSMADALLTPRTVAYMKAHEPVGCRDRTTQSLLEARGIETYFSSCLTLTLDCSYRHAPPEECDGVVFVDPFRPFTKEDFRRGRGEIFRHPLMAMKIFRKLCRQPLRGQSANYKWKHFWQIGAFIKAYRSLFSDDLLVNAEYFSHGVRENLFGSEQDKFEYAKSLLERYARARFCVTSRIHCALPCVAMGTPVVFVNATGKDIGNGRFDGMLEFFNVVEIRNDRLVPIGGFHADGEKRIGCDADIPVKRLHLPFADKLKEVCRRFAEE